MMERQRLDDRFAAPSTRFSGGRQPGNSLTPPPPKGGEGVRESHSPEPVRERAEIAAMIRCNFPVCVAFADAVRAVFPDARLTYASESGQQIGTPSPRGIHPVPQRRTGKPIADVDIATWKGRRS